VHIGLTDSNSSCLIHAPGTVHTRYVVMPDAAVRQRALWSAGGWFESGLVVADGLVRPIDSIVVCCFAARPSAGQLNIRRGLARETRGF